MTDVDLTNIINSGRERRADNKTIPIFNFISEVVKIRSHPPQAASYRLPDSDILKWDV
jgi:hypothetical protein